MEFTSGQSSPKLQVATKYKIGIVIKIVIIPIATLEIAKFESRFGYLKCGYRYDNYSHT